MRLVTVTMQLIPGEYEVEEIKAPEHYLLANTKYTVNVIQMKSP